MKLLPEPGFTLVQKYTGEIFQISKPTYYRGVKAGTQPKAIPITDGRVAIPNSEINKHILKLLEVAEMEAKKLQAEAEEAEQDKAPQKRDEEEVEDIEP